MDGSHFYSLYLLVYVSTCVFFTSLLRHTFLMLPHKFASQNLPNRGLRQLRPEFIVGRDLIGRKVFLAVGLDLVHRQRFTGLDHDPGFDRLAAVRVRDAAHADLQDLGMRGDDFLQLTWPDLEA